MLELQPDHYSVRIVVAAVAAAAATVNEWTTLDRPGPHEARLAALVEFLLWCAENPGQG
jgi:hypothetical protein